MVSIGGLTKSQKIGVNEEENFNRHWNAIGDPKW
jgi:hypothetical protein